MITFVDRLTWDCWYQEYIRDSTSICKQMENTCPFCNKNETELYQLDFEGCFDCWMDKTNPRISNWRYLILLRTIFM